MKKPETQEEKTQWHNKAVAVMKNVLTRNAGWPQCTDEQIMDQIGPMWDALVEADLIPEGATQKHFVDAAQRKYAEAQINQLHKMVFF